MAFKFNPFTGNLDTVVNPTTHNFGLTDGGVVFSNAGVLAVDATNLFYNDTTNTLLLGDPGSEAAGININGVTYDSRLKVSAFGATQLAEVVFHRHSTTVPAALIGSRSNSDTSSHGVVTTAMPLFQVHGVGWTGSHYDFFGAISFESDSGTISTTSSPGKIRFYTTPDGSNTLAEALSINSAKLVQAFGDIKHPAASATGLWTIENLHATGNLRLGVQTGVSTFVDIGPKWRSSDTITYVVGGGVQETVRLSPTWNAIATDATPDVAAIRAAPIFNHTTSAGGFGAQIAGMQFEPVMNSTGATSFNGSYFGARYAPAYTGGSNTLATCTGIIGSPAVISTGTITTCLGGQFQTLTVVGGTITTAISLQATGPFAFFGGTIGTAIAFQSISPTDGTTKWNAQFTGSAPSYFAGSTSFGHTTAPNYQVDTTGARIRGGNPLDFGGTGASDATARLLSVTGGLRMQGINGTQNRGIIWDFNNLVAFVKMGQIGVSDTFWSDFTNSVFGNTGDASITVQTIPLQSKVAVTHQGTGSPVSFMVNRAEDTNPANVIFASSRGTLAAPTAVVAGGILQYYRIAAFDGTDFHFSHEYEHAIAAGSTVGANNVTGALNFKTAHAGTLHSFLYTQGTGTLAAFTKLNGITRSDTANTDRDIIMASTGQANMFFLDCGLDRLGLGTNSPDTFFHVAGAVHITGDLELDGALNHDGTTVGFYGVTPVVRAAAYTQTYATATRTHANLTSATLTDSTGGTANTTLVAVAAGTDLTTNATINDNFADLTAQVNALRVDLENAKQMINSLVDDSQAIGIAQ